MTKICKECKVEKALTEFYKDAESPLGVRGNCKECKDKKTLLSTYKVMNAQSSCSRIPSRIRFIDLFCGIGGFRLAAESLAWKCVFSSDIDPFSKETYRCNFGEVPSGDIYKVASDDVPDFDVLLAGFPCQSFSYSGKCRGLKDERGALFYEVLRIIKERQPSAFLLENVKGLVSHDSGNTLAVIEKELSAAGYHIQWQILNSAEFGVPQNRERWYCVGFLNKTDFHFPVPNPTMITIAHILEKNVRNPSLKISDKWKKRIEKHFSSIEDRVRHLDFSKDSNRGKYGVFSFLKSDNTLRFHMGDEKKTQIQEGFFASVKSVAPTIIAGRVPQLWDLQRKLTVRESARLQGFPDSFVFPCSDAQSYKQIGNSVTVPVIKILLTRITQALGKRSKPYGLQ